MKVTEIVAYSHGFYVKPANDKVKYALIQYCKTLGQWEVVKRPPDWRPQRVLSRIFAGATKDRKEFRFHITLLEEVIRALKGAGVYSDEILVRQMAIPKAVEVDFPLKEELTARDYQEGLIDFLSNPNQKIKVTNLQTGKGKTFCALSAMINLGVRTVIQLRGGYVARWMEDLKGLFNFKKGELLVVRGRDALQSIINMAKEGELEAKVIVITSKTVYNYLKEYETNPHDNIYGIRPEEFYGLLGVGLRIIDEAHEDYHHNFRTDLYSNVQSSIHLSATLNTEDPFKKRMYDIALPKDSWHEGVKYDAYIGVKALMYETEDMSNIRTQERGQDMYSHNAYEKSIMKNKKMLESYLRIICYPVFKYYLEDDWKPGQKCLIFCGMVEMCEIVRDYLRKITSEIVINEFVSETDESVLAESDIIVSTVESCGTAQDIPNLKVSVLTRALRKLETNEQVKGRLRKLKKWPEVTPIFVYLVNASIPKHMDYHDVKKDQFAGKCLYHEEERMPFDLETT
tara:strand:- start:8601 stop:10139 length:1539 start_codon:yes stop_codon:yes gene_type:complete